MLFLYWLIKRHYPVCCWLVELNSYGESLLNKILAKTISVSEYNFPETKHCAEHLNQAQCGKRICSLRQEKVYLHHLWTLTSWGLEWRHDWEGGTLNCSLRLASVPKHLCEVLRERPGQMKIVIKAPPQASFFSLVKCLAGKGWFWKFLSVCTFRTVPFGDKLKSK